MNVFSIAFVCIITALLVKTVQPVSGEMSLLIVIGCLIAVAAALYDDVNYLMQRLLTIGEYAQISDGMLSVAVKVLGIGYTCELCSSCCKDAGQSALGVLVEITGKVSAMVICIPSVFSLLETVVKILE